MDINFTISVIGVINFIIGLTGFAIAMSGVTYVIFGGWSMYGSARRSFLDTAFGVVLILAGWFMLAWGW